MTNQEIAARLVVGIKTVETYVSRLFTKLSLPEDGGGHRRVLAVLTYLRQGGP